MIDHARLSKLKPLDTKKVALSSCEDRYKTIFKALDLITAEINSQIDRLDNKYDYILIKPNCIVTNRQLASTHIDALSATLDFISSLWDGKIIVAEGSGIGNTLEAFKNFGYDKLKAEHQGIEFLDLNYSDAVYIDVMDQNLKPFQVRVSNTVMEAPLKISVGPAKTHDSVVVTLSIKNMAFGSVLVEDKVKMHQGYKAINKTIAMLNEYTFPHIAVIDAWEAMEGNGPIDGKKVNSHFAVASANALAADVLTAELMGFNPLQIGYLNMLGAEKIKDQIEVIGCDPQSFCFHFKPHRTYLEQINWL